MKLTFPLLNTTIHVPVDDTTTTSKPSRRSLFRNKSENKISEAETAKKIEETSTSDNKEIVKTPESTEEKLDSAEPDSTQAQTTSTQSLLMVEVVNVTHEKFRQTEEIKVNITNK